MGSESERSDWELSREREDVVVRSQGVHGVSEACCRRMGAGRNREAGYLKAATEQPGWRSDSSCLSHPELSSSLPLGLASSVQLAEFPIWKDV